MSDLHDLCIAYHHGRLGVAEIARLQARLDEDPAAWQVFAAAAAAEFELRRQGQFEALAATATSAPPPARFPAWVPLAAAALLAVALLQGLAHEGRGPAIGIDNLAQSVPDSCITERRFTVRVDHARTSLATAVSGPATTLASYRNGLTAASAAPDRPIQFAFLTLQTQREH